MKPKRELSRKSILSAQWHAKKAADLLQDLVAEGESEAKLTEAVKALRQIANTSCYWNDSAQKRSRGIARGALKRIGVDP